MDKEVEAKNNTIEILDEFLNESESFTVDSATLTEDIAIFRADKDALAIQIGISQVDPAGITEDQTAAKRAVAKYIFNNICSPSLRYARNIESNDLQHFFKDTEDMLFKYSLTALGPHVITILAKATQLMEDVPAYVTSTGMTAAIIAGGTTANSDFTGFFGKAKNAIHAANAALIQIDVIQKRMWDIDFANMLNDTTFFATTHPNFGKDMATAMKIDDLPTEHTGIEGYGHDENNEVIIGMTITNLDLTTQKPMTTNNLGFYHDDTFQWGTYRYKYEAPGKISQTITETILRGKTHILNVILLTAPLIA